MRRLTQFFSRENQRGDSLLEVMLAISVMSMIAVGSMTVMNRGNNIAINSLWRTGARMAINSQAELLAYYHASNSAGYACAFTSSSVPPCTAPSPKFSTSMSDSSHIGDATGTTGSNGATTWSTKAFRMTTSGPVSVVPTCNTSAAWTSAGTGVWIDAVHYVNFTDFYIKACWAGQHGMAASGNSNSITIVRLYDN